MGKKKKSLVEKVKEVLTKEEVEEVQVNEEVEPKEHEENFGIPSDDEVLVELEEE